MPSYWGSGIQYTNLGNTVQSTAVTVPALEEFILIHSLEQSIYSSTNYPQPRLSRQGFLICHLTVSCELGRTAL